MCRDNSKFYDLQQIYSYYELADNLPLEFEPLYHEVAGTDCKWPMLIMQDGKKQIHNGLWGMMPWYAKTKKDADSYLNKLVNARQETIFESNTFKYSILKKRCIIPSTGFFEHHHEIGGKRKMPYFITGKNSGILSLAGLYNNWVDKETGEMFTTFSIITTAANDMMAKIHNGGPNSERMPLMLKKEMTDEWIDPKTPIDEIKKLLNYRIGANELQALPVAGVRGKNKLSGEEIIKEYQYPGYSLDLTAL
ncbi:MAG: SOS response-associated peptidase [Ginsengibacter sp.]